jgi:ABC-type uncharacterized transport system permease subunit
VPELAVLLFWPAFAGYAEAAAAYASELVRPGRLARQAIWGVRLGWLAQTGLLVDQAARAESFPWASSAGSLNLFVWLTVATYLLWGCRASFRLLGLAVMPLAVVLFLLAWAAGGAGEPRRSEFGNGFLALHVGLVLAAFAAFTLAGALAALYLWQERRLKRHEPGILRLRAPSLASLDTLAGRTVAAGLVALTLGIGIGFARLTAEDRGVDPIIAVTVLAWVVYAGLVVLRYEWGWRGRRAAQLVLLGFLVVLVVRVGLTPVAHFS